TKFVRVRLDKVTNLMSLAGEIGRALGTVLDLPAVRAEIEREDVGAVADRLEGLIRDLQDGSASLRLVPISNAFAPLNRAVRDLSMRTGKPLELTTEGEDIEIDKLMVEALTDPLIHLVRNAADHGIEPPDVRADMGKPKGGRLHLSAHHRGDHVMVLIQDDGRGLDRQGILDKAIRQGLITPEVSAELPDRDVWELVFKSGFSTASGVSEISGRGVGMEVVRSSIVALGGTVRIQSEKGRGTTVQMILPLTLAFLDGMVVRSGEVTYVIPITSIAQVFRAEVKDVERVESERMDLIHVGDELVRGLCLQRFYAPEKHPEPVDWIGRLVVVVRTSRGMLAIPIDELLGHEKVTMKPLTGPLGGIRASAGCGLLRSGGVAIALNCEYLNEQLPADDA
ncbi:MAG: ATP-binding protein, partial [Myxococcota bacterium]